MAIDKDKYVSLKDMQIGGKFTRPLLVSTITDHTAKNGKPFVKATLKDGESEITAMMFDTSSAQLAEEGITSGSVADIMLDVSEYNQSKSFRITSVKPCGDKSITPFDFVKLPPVDREVMFDEICGIIRSAADDCSGQCTPISQLALKILEDNKENYFKSSAAVSIHHNILGGLIYHSYRMVKAADALCGVYDILDRELMVCGAALHDIGKLWEYKTSETGDAEFTESGVLFGHLYMGASLIKQYTKSGKYNMEKVQLLVHMILSHHGTLEFGAVTPPAIPEALALYYIDNIDARLYIFEQSYEQLDSGQLTEKKPFGLENRVYKPQNLKHKQHKQ